MCSEPHENVTKNCFSKTRMPTQESVPAMELLTPH